MSELAVILLVVIAVLGFKKLPELARSAGKATRIFKSEAKALKEQDAGAPGAGAGRVVQGTVVGRDESAPRS
ncbi:twin-arginine translocase TatA/TatE family subunit [Streptomyces yaanensis]|uniref:Twin-arginine translocase TatA/TatE family subunit n=1 Tax=Streptomyces yaanensis TaxID=1142239 RepID=A0ABV7SDM7_9ACTN|nr:twin-arginine translocase TatA/TatE family subunit [Streptomyces sp. CGMCC 4.7035]WNB96827.1 twin-arginine translocase TatA/TatE family subunit [Streptomyces sp. CGMCC 4.7035]